MKLPVKFDKLLAVLKNLSAREKIVLYCAVVFTSVAMVDRLIIRSVSGKLKSLDAEIAAQEAEIRGALRIMSNKDRIEIQKANFASYMAGQKTETEEITLILKEIEALAGKTRVSLVDMKPAGTKETANSRKYMITVNCEGKMEELADFFYSIESHKKLFTIEKYQLNPKSKDTQTLRCSLVISSLVVL